MFIRTERLSLRPGWPEDLDDLVEELNGDAQDHSIGVAGLPDSVAELRAYLEKPRAGRLPHFFIDLREGDGPRLIGAIGLEAVGEEVELGYWIGPRHRGHGYAGEAVRAVLEQAALLGLRQIVAAHFANEASARVLEQSGFQATDQLRPRRSEESATPERLYVAVLGHRGGPIGTAPRALHA